MLKFKHYGRVSKITAEVLGKLAIKEMKIVKVNCKVLQMQEIALLL